MNQWKVEANQQELEQVFAESRRYPLLSAPQEREIDASKWQAVAELLQVVLTDPAARDWFRQLLIHIECQPLDVAGFANREHHFLLRRELSSCLPGGRQAATRKLLALALGDNDLDAARELLTELELPASLVAGIGNQLARFQGQELRCAVADALTDWMSTAAPQDSETVLAPDARHALRLALSRYNQARDTLVLHNLRLVYSIAGKSAGKGAPYRDLIQEGTLGLIRAAEKFQARKGYRFSTYSYNWISQSIRRYLQDSAAMIRYPSHVRDQVGRLYREQEAFRAVTGQEPDNDTLARAAGLDRERTRALQQLRNVTVSLNTPAFDDDDEALIDQLTDPDANPPENEAENASLHRHLLQELEHLDQAEREVVVARWGLLRGRPLSRAEIADRMSVSREWVRQLERSALDKLAHSRRLQATARDLANVP